MLSELYTLGHITSWQWNLSVYNILWRLKPIIYRIANKKLSIDLFGDLKLCVCLKCFLQLWCCENDVLQVSNTSEPVNFKIWICSCFENSSIIFYTCTSCCGTNNYDANHLRSLYRIKNSLHWSSPLCSWLKK